MMSVDACYFCKRIFTDQQQFWEHMTKGSCGTEPPADDLVTPCFDCAPPPPSLSPCPNNAGLVQKGTSTPVAPVRGVVGKAELSFPPAPTNAPPSSIGFNSVQTIPNEISEVPLIVDQFEGSENISSVRFTNDTASSNAQTCENSVSVQMTIDQRNSPVKRSPCGRYGQTSSLPQDVRESTSVQSSVSQPVFGRPIQPYYMCTLCKTDFPDRTSMLKHVRSKEHEDKIKLGKSAAGDVIPPNEISKQAQPTAMLKDEMADLIRQIVREELPVLLRKELKNIFSTILSDSESGTSSPALGLSVLSENVLDSSGVIEVHNGVIRCRACDCSVTSRNNLPIHLEGKKHKAKVEKMLGYR